MSIPGSAEPLLLAQQGAGYNIERSLRFNSSDSAYLSRTPASAGNRKTWTFSFWAKRSNIVTRQILLEVLATANDTGYFSIEFTSDATAPYIALGGYNTTWRRTSQVFRDTSAWYHIVLAVDTTQATANNRIRLYVNGIELTDFNILANPSPNADTGVNAASLTTIGSGTAGSNSYSGYLADIHFIDGQALTPSSFAETNATTGQWVPKAYTGSYGTNGFQLKFADNSAATATTLGKDTSGNGNNWTPNNLSVTAGAGNDSLVDTPTSFGTDTGAGGEVRGNYATLNPLQTKEVAVLSNGNLDYAAGSSVDTTAAATIIPTTGKWYWETTITSAYTSAYWGGTGVSLVNAPLAKVSESSTAGVWASTDSSLGGLWINGSRQSTHTTWSNNDVIGCAFDAGAMTLEVYRNNVKLGSTISVPAGYYRPFVFVARDTASSVTNFGQRPFAYTAPSGFKALCDTNLPAPVVAKPSTVMDVALWTGTGSARSITGLSFSPDFTWIKQRSSTEPHVLSDSVRGSTKSLYSNTTGAEETEGPTAYNSDGFSLGTGWYVNRSGSTYVGWTWDAGSSTVTNTQGSITSQVRANASAGFSIVTYTGTGVQGTIGHGLGIAPRLIITKPRTGGGPFPRWHIYHKSIGATNVVWLDTTDAATSGPNYWVTDPTSTVFTVGNDIYGPNVSPGTFVAYCFAPVAGYSSFGSYTGNGSTDGPFVYTGFRPRWILIKRTDATQNWPIIDTSRDTYNVMNRRLFANLADAEDQGIANFIDITANGFKCRDSNISYNASGGTYIYAAFAENPFQYARAR